MFADTILFLLAGAVNLVFLTLVTLICAHIFTFPVSVLQAFAFSVFVYALKDPALTVVLKDKPDEDCEECNND